ncbi:hypothetical protein SAMN04487761_1694 [Lachnospiraceae bacterium C7]|nr:hypothetical protein SAMN04487761_1694 [Lachnospiraceae bacterium C7]
MNINRYNISKINTISFIAPVDSSSKKKDSDKNNHERKQGESFRDFLNNAEESLNDESVSK